MEIFNLLSTVFAAIFSFLRGIIGIINTIFSFVSFLISNIFSLLTTFVSIGGFLGVCVSVSVCFMLLRTIRGGK